MPNTSSTKWEILSNIWLTSGRIVTSISLIILPIAIVISHVVITDYISRLILSDPVNIYKKIPYLPLLIIFLNSFQILAFISILVIYPPYPAPYSAKKYFLKRGFSRSVKEYEIVKQVLYITVPLLIIVTSISVIDDLKFPHQTKSNVVAANENIILPFPFEEVSFTIHPYIEKFLFIRILLLLIVVSGILKLIFALIRRDFKLYFARGCFVLMQDAKNEADEMRYFVMGLNSYNSYLRRQIKLEISNLKQVYSQLATSHEQKDALMKKLSMLFLSDKRMERDTLGPLREVSKLLGKPLPEILEEQPLTNKLKEWGAAAAVIVPLIIQITTIVKH